MGAVLVFCLSKMWLKYIKDISMFNYKPEAISFYVYVFSVQWQLVECLRWLVKCDKAMLLFMSD